MNRDKMPILDGVETPDHAALIARVYELEQFVTNITEHGYYDHRPIAA